jgi:uncharacterized protein involved in outer membrane biogenesis
VRKIALAVIGLLILAAVTAALAVRSRLANDRIRTTLETQASAAIGESVHIGTLDVQWLPRPGLTLGAVTVGARETLRIERLVLSTGLRPLLSGHIAEADVLVEHSRLDAPRLFAVLTTPARAPASGSSSGLPLTIDAIRSIALRDVTLTSGNRTIVVDGDLAYAADGLNIQRLSARSDTTQLVASGAITDLIRRTGQLTIDASTLDLDGLIEFLTPFGAGPGSSSSPSTSSSPSRPFDVSAALTAKSGRALGAAFNDLAARCRVTNGEVTIDGLRLALFGGRFDGRVAVGTGAAEPRYNWQGAFSGIDVARVVEFAGSKGSISGTLQARVSLRGAGGTTRAALSTAAGTAQVVVSNGRVPGLEIVRTVIVAFGRPRTEHPAGSGEEFSQLAADLTVNGGRASTQNLRFASRDFDLRGTGSIDLRTEALAVDADLVLSRELSAQAGRDLYRYAREGDRIVLPARIGGTAAHPSVSIDLADALARAAQNELKKRARSFLERIIR